ncbi:MAG: T9SS type A sorting domain-containing protein, partial [Tannerella sp.]|nr:T9SS type A sorting domain-containing protein [Tannerella sp.]
LSSEWKEYTIDLQRANLSRIGCGFAWVTSQTENTSLQTLEFDLDDIVYHFETERSKPLFLRSYGILPVSDERSFINNFAYTYDNALLAIAMVKSGHVAYARQVADALAYCVMNDRYYEPGPIRNAYANGSPVSFPGWLSPRGGEFAMLPGFYNTAAAVWYEDRYAVSINTGVMAWAIEALLTVYDEAGTPDYLNASTVMADYILNNYGTNDPLGGFTGGEEGWEGQTEKLTYKSTEHNIDLISAFMHLYQAVKETKPQDAEKYLAAAREARDFVLAVYEDGCFYTGTGTDGITVNRENKPLDTNTWAILTLMDDREASGRWDPEEVYDFIGKTFTVSQGVDYNQDKDGIWNEGTAQLAVSAARLGKTAEYERLMSYLNGAAEADGSICSASIDGLTTGFESLIATEGGGTRAIPWVYDHRISLASTAWLAFAQLKSNPYFVSNETVAVSGGNALKLYPNPADGECMLAGLREGDVVSLYDLNGKQYMSRPAAGEIETVDTGRLQAGVYLLHVPQSSQTQTLKMIVRH